MANTTNFGWETPDDTDLVKDGASAMRTLGSAIDTSMADLKGGTTGQILSKNSNSDMDFIWTSETDPNAINKTIVDAKGDLIAGTAADTVSRLAVGTNGYVLTADSGQATGLSWTAPAGNKTISQIASGSLSGSQLSLTGLSSYDTLIISLYNFGLASGNETGYNFTINSDTGTNYNVQGWGFRRYSAFNNSMANTDKGQSNTYIDLSCGAGDFYSYSNNGQIFIVLENCKNSGFTNGYVQTYGSWYDAGTVRGQYGSSMFIYKSAAAVSSIQLNRTLAANFNSGTYTVWGA